MEPGLDRCRNLYEKGKAMSNADEEAEAGTEDALRHRAAPWRGVLFSPTRYEIIVSPDGGKEARFGARGAGAPFS